MRKLSSLLTRNKDLVERSERYDILMKETILLDKDQESEISTINNYYCLNVECKKKWAQKLSSPI